MERKNLIIAVMLAILMLGLASLANAQGPYYGPGEYEYRYDAGPCPGCNQYGYGYAGQTPYGQSEYAGSYAQSYRMGRNARAWGFDQNTFYPHPPVVGGPPPAYYGNSYYNGAQRGYMTGYWGFHPYPSDGRPHHYWGR